MSKDEGDWGSALDGGEDDDGWGALGEDDTQPDFSRTLGDNDLAGGGGSRAADEEVVTDDWDASLDGVLEDIERQRAAQLEEERRRRDEATESLRREEEALGATAAAAVVGLQRAQGVKPPSPPAPRTLLRHALNQTDPDEIIRLLNVHASSGYDYGERLRRLRFSLNLPAGAHEVAEEVASSDGDGFVGGAAEASPSRTVVHLEYFAAVRDLAQHAASTGDFAAADKLYSGAITAYSQAQAAQKDDDDTNLENRLSKLRERFLPQAPPPDCVVAPPRILTSNALHDSLPGVVMPSKLLCRDVSVNKVQ